MKPAPFSYAKARSVEHAIELLCSQEGARILAGGQSLMATLNMRLDAPPLLVDINGIPGLSGITVEEGYVTFGALVRHVEALRSPVVGQHVPLWAKALPHVAHAAIRNRGTVGGSVALADPAAELPACLLALAGEVEIAGASGRRTVAAGDFFRGLFETALGAGEILTALRVPAATPAMRYGFAELARRHGDYAMVGLAASARIADGRYEDARLVFFGVAATPVRARAAEGMLCAGRVGTALEDVLVALQSDLDPEADIQASAAAKRHLAGVLLRRVVKQMGECPA